MTYQDLINKVLLKLRENQITVLTANYTQLIGDLVNEAKMFVEDAWSWRCLNQTITFNTVIGQKTYDLTALSPTGAVTSSVVTDQRSTPRRHSKDKEYLLYNVTSGSRLTHKPLDWITNHRAMATTTSQTSPATYAFRRTSAGLFVELADPPDAVYAMQVDVIVRQADLTATTDVLTCPARPVWKLAVAMASAERGSGRGQKAEDLYRQADIALQQAMDDDMEGDEYDLALA